MRIPPRLGLLVLLTAAACSTPSAPPDFARLAEPGDAPARTDSTRYTLRPTEAGVATTISFVYTNPLPTAVYIPNCRGDTALTLERWNGASWVPAWGPIVRDCLSPPIVVPHGEEYRGSIWVFGGYRSSNTYPQFSVEPIAGTYRIVWRDFLSSYDPNRYPFGEPVAEEHRVSNSFELRVGS